mgnify:CR=1 FL=1
MTRILVPVDGSKHALRGVRKLIGIAQWWLERPEIVPLYVHLPVPRIGGMASLIGAPALRRYYKEEGEAALAPPDEPQGGRVLVADGEVLNLPGALSRQNDPLAHAAGPGDNADRRGFAARHLVEPETPDLGAAP